ncbi:MAG: M48 family metalloprotease [Elusimicrobia bacterium]|nr:M48 family metalloprotease [Elusimicrobiota bacterium]
MPGFLRTIPQTGLATDSQPEQDAWHILTFNLTLEIFQSADQFAFIIGHEMAHIVFGHSLESPRFHRWRNSRN